MLQQEAATNLGNQIVDLLQLQVENNKINTTWGEKTIVGIGRIIERMYCTHTFNTYSPLDKITKSDLKRHNQYSNIGVDVLKFFQYDVPTDTNILHKYGKCVEKLYCDCI